MTTMTEHPRHPKLHSSIRTRKEDRSLELDDDAPNLRSLVIPWASMVVVAVISTGIVLYENHCHEIEDHFNNKYYSSFLLESTHTDDEGSSRNESILERLLSAVTVEQQHVHHPVYEESHASLFPLTTSDRLGFFFAIIGLMVAAGGGIGGGGILVPIYILVMGFSPKHGEICWHMIAFWEPDSVAHVIHYLMLRSASYSIVEHYRVWWCHFELYIECAEASPSCRSTAN
jgi:hypothetical protein